ncbi:hypothetical protein [Thalassolituus sp.]|uniref:hypothetical protein n=1 Tax=Thalassolituus sp. TaxID=2030822 RepID=UPI0027D6F88A|nr:hypothetical protein [Thalassolituus sp.]MDQ4426352.1 hypothetical protein [Thalassolituus sp.]
MTHPTVTVEVVVAVIAFMYHVHVTCLYQRQRVHMKRAAILSSTLGIALIAFSSAVAANIEEIDPEKAQSCYLIETLEVSDNSREKALNKLKKEAAETRADSILILDSSESRFRKPTLAGGIKTVNKVTLEAELYDCLQQNKRPDTSSGKKEKKKEKSIKERLEILQNLRDDDLITGEEYSQKKSEILQDL